MKRIVVTGATSMIGISIIEECLAREIEKVYAVVRLGSKNLLRLPCDERIKVIECDMEEYASLGDFIHEPCDVYYHISWSASGSDRNESAATQIDNIKATLAAVRAAKLLAVRNSSGLVLRRSTTMLLRISLGLRRMWILHGLTVSPNTLQES